MGVVAVTDNHPRDPWLPRATDYHDIIDTEDLTEPVKVYVTPSEKDLYRDLARQGGLSLSALLRPHIQDGILTQLENGRYSFDARHLNYLAARRAERDRLTENRIDTFYKRVDDALQNRLSWDTPARRIARVVRNFHDEAEDYYEAGFIEDATYQEFLRYLHKQFSDYKAAQEQSTANREDRSAAFSMGGPKHAQEFHDELGFAVSNIIRSCEGVNPTPDRATFQNGITHAQQAAALAACPADKTERDVEAEVKERAVEGDTLCDDDCLLDQAATLISEDAADRAIRMVCQKAASIYPNEHSADTDTMLERARQRAAMPAEPASTDRQPDTDPRVETALDAVALEARSIDPDATREVAHEQDQGPLDPLADNSALASADGGHESTQQPDGERHNDDERKSN